MSIKKESKIAVTGVAGHLGSHLATALISAGFKVVGLDLAPPPVFFPKEGKFIKTDLLSSEVLEKALTGVDIIAHCASIHPWKSYTDRQYIDLNIKGTWSLYQTASKMGINRIVLTSSIAAVGCCQVPVKSWPVNETQTFSLGDIYSLTKHTQEEIARMFALDGKIRTIALRPPSFMPKTKLETGFNLTGCYAVVSDIVSAHMSAIRTMAGLKIPPVALSSFETFFITNYLPYTRKDGLLLESGQNLKKLVEKYWPKAYPWLAARGYDKTSVWLPAVYDLSKAKQILNWEPAYNFEDWFTEVIKDPDFIKNA